jgi:hypothetical protein
MIEAVAAAGPVTTMTAVLFAAARPLSVLWGIVVPGVVFTLSFLITWALYRKFAGKSR